MASKIPSRTSSTRISPRSGMPSGVSRTQKTDYVPVDEQIKVNKETLQALNLLNKTLPSLGQKTTTKNLATLEKKTKEAESIKDKAQKVEKEALRELMKAVNSIKAQTGIAQEQVIKQLAKSDSDIFKALPAKLQKALQANIGIIGSDEMGNSKLEQKLSEYISEQTEVERHNKEKTKEFFNGMLQRFDKTVDRNKDILKTAVFGPLSLLISPLEDFFGGDAFDLMKGAFGKVFGKKKEKKNPTITDVAKNGDMGILFLWNKIKHKFEDKDEKGESFLDKFLGKVPIAGLAGTLMKAGAFAAIIGSLIMAVVDGIKGMNMAKEWGTGKVAGFIGGFLGGTEKGWKGAFKSAGKWALMGVGVGFLTAGPVGAIIGGFIGAAIGGILGFIGGEKIAKFFQGIFDWGKKQLDKAGAFIKDSAFIQSFITWGKSVIENLFDFAKDTFADIKALLKGEISLWDFFKSFIGNLFSAIGTAYSNFLTKNPIGQWISKYIINPVVDFFREIGDTFAFFGSMPFDDLLKTVVSGNFGRDLEAYKAGKDKERKTQDILNSSQYAAWTKSLTAAQVGSMMKLTPEQRTTSFLATSYGKEYSEQYKATHVDDAIIRPDGTIIRTHPDDTIIATKNDPSLNGFSVASTRGSDITEDSVFSDSGSTYGSSSIESKLDKMVALLSAILSKDPVQISMPKQTTSDLDSIIRGLV